MKWNLTVFKNELDLLKESTIFHFWLKFLFWIDYDTLDIFCDLWWKIEIISEKKFDFF